MNNTETQSIESIWQEQLSGYDCDPDLAYAKNTFFNQSSEAISVAFSRSVIERANELRVMPDVLFNTYFHFFIDFLMKTEHEPFDASEIASCFTSLLKEKLDSNSITSSELVKQSKETVDYLTCNIDFFNEDADIYGDLEEKLQALKSQLNNLSCG
ncbi:hypothetical protein KIJ96_05375 [Pseudoalteromonas piscicida]|uniref:hypothetical protein n=1 Tax=Pseudoalteromonas piscicida TaxID=43662 RepID=UPI001D0B6AAB|nr:hypothetical protein [Pseudoalteromonas piscicida]UDM62676.1 hypothetical protein KIJ96_05375 [Pseudoalteromonas piscicida]